jgi:hypothetical protein
MNKPIVSVTLALALSTAGALTCAQTVTTAPLVPPPPPWGGANVPPPAGPYATAPVPQPPPPIIVDRQSRAERTIFELGGGLGAGVVIGGIGLYVGLLAGLTEGRATSRTFLESTAIGGVIGAAIGVPVGVYLVGNNFRGNGGLGWTLLGSLAGGGIAFGFAYAASNGDMPAGVAILTGLVLPVAGAVCGYELTSDTDSRHPRARGPMLLPTVAALPGRGGVVGIVGTF